MLRNLCFLALVAVMASGCSVRYSRWERWEQAPKPAPNSFRCYRGGMPAPPQEAGPYTFWCTPKNSSDPPPSYYGVPDPYYSTPYYGS